MSNVVIEQEGRRWLRMAEERRRREAEAREDGA